MDPATRNFLRLVGVDPDAAPRDYAAPVVLAVIRWASAIRFAYGDTDQFQQIDDDIADTIRDLTLRGHFRTKTAVQRVINNPHTNYVELATRSDRAYDDIDFSATMTPASHKLLDLIITTLYYTTFLTDNRTRTMVTTTTSYGMKQPCLLVGLTNIHMYDMRSEVLEAYKDVQDDDDDDDDDDAEPRSKMSLIIESVNNACLASCATRATQAIITAGQKEGLSVSEIRKRVDIIEFNYSFDLIDGRFESLIDAKPLPTSHIYKMVTAGADLLEVMANVRRGDTYTGSSPPDIRLLAVAAVMNRMTPAPAPVPKQPSRKGLAQVRNSKRSLLKKPERSPTPDTEAKYVPDAPCAGGACEPTQAPGSPGRERAPEAKAASTRRKSSRRKQSKAAPCAGGACEPTQAPGSPGRELRSRTPGTKAAPEAPEVSYKSEAPIVQTAPNSEVKSVLKDAYKRAGDKDRYLELNSAIKTIVKAYEQRAALYPTMMTLLSDGNVDTTDDLRVLAIRAMALFRTKNYAPKKGSSHWELRLLREIVSITL
jgi:hypothetical protein